MRKGVLIAGIALFSVGLIGLIAVGVGASSGAGYGRGGCFNRGFSDRFRGDSRLRKMPNGKRIFMYGVGRSGRPIVARMRGMGRMRGMNHHKMAGMGCADCHRADGRGGKLRMRMGVYEAHDIRRSHLREEGYDDTKLKRAITEGVGADGKRLKFPMPRWSMSDRDLDDLVDYLKTL